MMKNTLLYLIFSNELMLEMTYKTNREPATETRFPLEKCHYQRPAHVVPTDDDGNNPDIKIRCVLVQDMIMVIIFVI